MYRRVITRSPLPASVCVTPASKLSAEKAKRAAKNGAKVIFVSSESVKLGKLKDVPLGFKGTVGQVQLVSSESRSLVAGLGSCTHVWDYRTAVTKAVRQAQALGVSSLSITPTRDDVLTMSDVFHPARPLKRDEVVERTTTFAVAAAYNYTRMKSKPDVAAVKSTRKRKGRTNPIGASKTLSDTEAAVSVPNEYPREVFIVSNRENAIRTGEAIGACINDARNLGNLREDEGTPEFYAEWSKRFLLPEGIEMRHAIRGEQLRQAGLNLLYNVGKGSIHEPHMLVLEYVGNKRSPHSTALIGKGVTFDCGGHNIKPYGSMETMHTDMMGAATVLSTLKAIATLKLPINVVAAVGLVENAIGPESYFPSSILTSLKGLTVEVLNTDAEGRLVLADVLTFVQKHAKLHKTPSTIIDVATLTGAIVVSLGSRRAGLFCNDAELSEQLMLSGTRVGEEVWPMPVGAEHMEAVRGGIADLLNTAPGRQGGSCTAAAFLSNFVESGKKWAHLDIAGPADVGDKPKGFNPAGVSGYGVQLLVDYLRR